MMFQYSSRRSCIRQPQQLRTSNRRFDLWFAICYVPICENSRRCPMTVGRGLGRAFDNRSPSADSNTY